MKNFQSRLALILVAVVCAAPAYAQDSLDKLVAAAKADGSLMVYHTSPLPIIGPVFRAYEKKYGIEIQNYHATGNPLTVRFSSEAASGRIVADVFYASDTTTYSRFQDLFQKLTDENLPGYARVPDVARLDSDLAVSPSQTSFAMFYNTKRLSKADVPSKWLDLADPKWKGQAMMVDPRSSATYRSAYNTLRKVHPQLLTKIRDLAPRIVESGTPAVQQLAAGTASYAFMGYPSHATPLMAKKAPVEWATIEGPELTRGVWVGAAKGPHPNAARLFLHFFLSDEGQHLYCKSSEGSKTALDRPGMRTGCAPFAEDVVFLPDTPLSREDSAAVLRELGLN